MEQDAFVTHRKNGVEDSVELAPVSRQPSITSSKAPSASHYSIPVDLGTSPIEHVESIGYSTNAAVSSNQQTRKQVVAERFQLCACFGWAFVIGWNDGSTGPLLPRIQEVYGVGFTVVSMIFVCTTLGFIVGALMNFWFTERFRFGKTIIIGSLCQVVAYALQVAALPFPAFAISFAINGFGCALELSQTIGLVASLKRHGDIKMGFFHAFYGLGALSAPFVATQFAQTRHWSFHYLISLCLAILNTISFSTVFGFKTQDECLKLIGQDVGEKSTSQDSSFNQVLRIKAVHFLAFFILFYVGVEVTIGGWVVTFMLDVRGGGPSSGYISSGFFGGLMLGRVLLLWVNKKLGERLALFLYAVLAIGLQLIVWLVPSLIGGAVAVSFVGLLLGPMYPIAMVQAGRILPAWLLTSAVGWISGFGQAGSAALPFMTGAISQKHGIKSLQPLVIAMMGFMIFLWYLVPARKRDS
ncbi:hypothetical protein D9756_006376 [Leucocoprinus leucothites]|uniref:Major facilitator superfamily (MFS) profile domain-containing protein n=1 Tax=Leucocoprinus leucothites TaxID=201217 RepID=A0A8H5LGV5_9AGAR|nr:hypothetical protein D9756_006376 [Leucoagaricus leucothites]